VQIFFELFFSLGHSYLLFAAFWNQHISFAAFLELKSLICKLFAAFWSQNPSFALHAICNVLEIK
jgi:hypothetical protein